MTSPFKLLDFPDEILFLIAEYLESSRRDLCAFACVCIRISEIASRYCYRRLLVKSEDEMELLSNAVQRKPQRLAFIQELVFVPALQQRAHIRVDRPYHVLLSADMLQHLTVELPFHYDEWQAATFKSQYQDRLGELFEDASLVSCIPKPRPFHRLRSCKLNFQCQQGRPWSLGKHCMVFLHDTLQCLTLVAASLGPHDVSYLRHYKKLTPLSRLHLDHCDISPQALETILSLPRALQSLELTEYCYRRPFVYGLHNPGILMAALSPHEYSLRNLHVGLRIPDSDLRVPFDFCNFKKLETFTVDCGPLGNLVYCPQALQNRLLQITVSQGIWYILSIVLPERPFCLVLQTPPGNRLNVADDRATVEKLGRSLRRTTDQGPPTLPSLDTRLIISRQTESKGAIAPYLYNEHVPEKVVCYDSFASAQDWDFNTDSERQTNDKIRRLRDMTPFPHPVDGEVGDFLLGQLNSA